jgi:phosphoribosylanthranilate isomerase
MKIKICGITRLDDALAAVEYGADTLGFIFVPDSPRYVRPSAAQQITSKLPPEIITVGVFVNESRATIARTILDAGIHAIQLHGDETPEETEGFGIRVVKGYRVSPGFDTAQLSAYRVYAHLLDAYVGGRRGGTGQTFDWQVAFRARAFGKIILSGGLRPANVAEAIRAARPDAVDVSSGVERTAGVKDHAQMKEFMQAAREAFAGVQTT